MQTTLVKPAPETNGFARHFNSFPPRLATRVNLFETPKAEPKPAAMSSPLQRRAHDDHALIEVLLQSKVYRDYERAFTETTGLPVALRPVESWQLPLHGKRHEAPYCALMSEKSRACAACLLMQERLSEAATSEWRTMVCSSGLSESAVPVRLGDRLIGFLQTGQVFSKKPTPSQFERTATMLKERGVDVERNEAKEAYFA